MRKLLSVGATLAMLTAAEGAFALGAPTEMTSKPWSVGLGIGFSAIQSAVGFSMEIPVEYSFKVGPGALAVHAGFGVTPYAGAVALSFPLGVRYKMKVASFPLYVYPLIDLGPTVTVAGGAAFGSGFLRVGGGVSYVVHPMVEVFAQPLSLGATFDSAGGAFLYNFQTGVQARF